MSAKREKSTMHKLLREETLECLITKKIYQMDVSQTDSGICLNTDASIAEMLMIWRQPVHQSHCCQNLSGDFSLQFEALFSFFFFEYFNQKKKPTQQNQNKTVTENFCNPALYLLAFLTRCEDAFVSLPTSVTLTHQKKDKRTSA